MAPFNITFTASTPLGRRAPAIGRGNLFQLVLSGIAHVLAWPIRVSEARAAMRQLGSMSEHELKDIGLTRQDLRDATGLVLDDDPTQLLARRAAERSRFPRHW